MGVTCGEGFLRIVISNSGTFGLNRGSAEARQLGFFFERTLGGFGFENLFVFFAVLCILQTEQGVQAGE